MSNHHQQQQSHATDAASHQNNPTSLSGRKLTYPAEIDDQLVKWVRIEQARGGIVSADLLRKEALRLIQPYCYEFKASTGWLDKFLTRHKITLLPSHHKAISPSNENRTLYNESVEVSINSEQPLQPAVTQQPNSSMLDNHDDDDDDDDDDESDKKENLTMITHQRPVNPEKLKAFNMFVRLFVDENLDRLVPISKQPKEKINAIIISCQRQFPEFSDRARKRIRTYLKSCRRSTKLREPSSRPSMSHIPATQLTEVNNILAKACRNESHEVAKRQRLDSNGTSLPTAFFSTSNTTLPSLPSGSTNVAVTLPPAGDVTMFQSFVSSKIKEPAVKLSQTEVTSIKGLISGYKQSAMFLQRSAEELERFLMQCEAYVDKVDETITEDKIIKNEKHIENDSNNSAKNILDNSSSLKLTAKSTHTSLTGSSVNVTETVKAAVMRSSSPKVSTTAVTLPSLIPRSNRTSASRTSNANNSLIVDSLLKTKVEALKEKLVIQADMIHGTATSVISPTRLATTSKELNIEKTEKFNEKSEQNIKPGLPLQLSTTTHVNSPKIIFSTSDNENSTEQNKNFEDSLYTSPPLPKLLSTGDNNNTNPKNATNKPQSENTLNSNNQGDLVSKRQNIMAQKENILNEFSIQVKQPELKPSVVTETEALHPHRLGDHRSPNEPVKKEAVQQLIEKKQLHRDEREQQQKQQEQHRHEIEQAKQHHQEREQHRHEQQQQHRHEREHRLHEMEMDEFHHGMTHTINHHPVTADHGNIYGADIQQQIHNNRDNAGDIHNRMSHLNAQHISHEQMYRHGDKPTTPLSLDHLQNYTNQHSPSMHTASSIYQQSNKQMHKHASLQSATFNLPHVNDHLSPRDDINHTPPMQHNSHQGLSNHVNHVSHGGDHTSHHTPDSMNDHSAHANPFAQQYYNSTRHAHQSPKMSLMSQQTQGRGLYSGAYHHQATPVSHHPNIFSFDGVSQQVLDSPHQQYMHQRMSPHGGGYHGNILSPSSSPHVQDHLARQSHLQELNRQQSLSDLGRQAGHSDYGNMSHTLQFDLHQAH